MSRLVPHPTPILFFTCKGGVGKTSTACATAIALADAGRRVLLVPERNCPCCPTGWWASRPSAVWGARMA